jgi:hypothetical protein
LFSLDRYAVGPGCVIVIWLAVAAVVETIWLVGLLTFLFGRRRKSRLLIWLGGIPLVVITCIALLVGGLFGFVMIRSMNPRYVYRDTFHEPASPDVHHIRSKVWSFADEAEVFIRFEARPETFRRIVPEKMEKVSYSDYKKKMPGSNLKPPAWCHRPASRLQRFTSLSPSMVMASASRRRPSS